MNTNLMIPERDTSLPARHKSPSQSPPQRRVDSQSELPLPIEEYQLRRSQRVPSPMDHSSLYDVSVYSLRRCSNQSPRTVINRNSNENNYLHFWGRRMTQSDLNFAVVLVGLRGFASLAILMLFLVTVGILYARSWRKVKRKTTYGIQYDLLIGNVGCWCFTSYFVSWQSFSAQVVWLDLGPWNIKNDGGGRE